MSYRQHFSDRFRRRSSLEEIAKHAFYDFRPEFAKEVRHGDFVVAGVNFGCGSYRETAAICLKALGVEVVIARSFSRAFFRNAVNNGLWLITLGDAQFDFNDGDVVDVDREKGIC
jgi:3-isopropylmalate/(R)-2-methylmalate dehydratase small subunit